MKCIGIDVSKSNFTVAYPTEKTYRVENFHNDNKGIKKFIATLENKNWHCVLEATGTYSSRLVYLLQEARGTDNCFYGESQTD